MITVSRSEVLRGYKCPQSGLWRIPLTKNPVTERTNLNTDTVIVDKCPTEYLTARPPPTEAIFNVFELKKQPEIVRYYHAAAGFPTKPTIKAINNKQYASWPGLTSEIVQKYYPESEETLKGHARKIKSG